MICIFRDIIIVDRTELSRLKGLALIIKKDEIVREIGSRLLVGMLEESSLVVGYITLLCM